MSESPRETYRRLAALAGDAAITEPERENARALMARYIKKYGTAVAIPEAEPEAEVRVPYASEYECRLGAHCALFAGAKLVDIVTPRAPRGRPATTARPERLLVFGGAESAVAAAAELYGRHRAVLARLLEVTENAYRHAAMPLPAGVKRSVTAASPLSDAMVQALRGAQAEGAAQRGVKRLGSRG